MTAGAISLDSNKERGAEDTIDRVRERIDKFANVRRDVVVLLMLDSMHVVSVDSILAPLHKNYPVLAKIANMCHDRSSLTYGCWWAAPMLQYQAPRGMTIGAAS
jgi:hypothetical protein